MNKITFLRHISEQPFIFATGLAALVHSTWALGTLFAGEMPSDLLGKIYWLAPAMLIAFALDVGQIATAAEIRAGQRSFGKYATFAILAATTFYLQFLYIAHHMPQLQLAPGISSRWLLAAQEMRDASIWIIPLLLPLSTLLYTLSTPRQQPHQEQPGSDALQPEIELLQPERALLQAAEATEAEAYQALAICPHCDWVKEYETEKQAQMALNAHSRYCKAERETATTPNGSGGFH